MPGPYLNLIRNPGDPFLSDASVYVSNYASFTNNGGGVTWVPFDASNFTGVLTDGSTLVTDLASTTSLFVGEAVIGTGLPVGGATIVSVDTNANTITLSGAGDCLGPRHPDRHPGERDRLPPDRLDGRSHDRV